VISSPWPNTMEIKVLKEFIGNSLPSERERFHVCQWVLSPTTKTIVGTFVPSYSNTIADLAKIVSPVLNDWLDICLSAGQVDRSCLPNIIICDYYNSFDFIQQIVHMNTTCFARK